MTEHKAQGRVKANPMTSIRSGIGGSHCHNPVGTGALAPSPYMPSTRAHNP